ncbi:MAG: tRNA lysidine(34) synthetase TilS [Candidatus Moranbacteria bacterium]|nr:tRNA lysidine(34) synthetase TilS [Candidatus Moranbacteria bacterium]
MPQAFIKRTNNFNFHHKLYKRGDKIILALSGGPDSTAMALIFSVLAKKYDLQLLGVHINYHLRKKDSEADEAFVKKLCKKLGIGLKIFHYKKGKKGNLEEQLRFYRYELFEKVRKEKSFNLIATAHTLDDQAETFLMNLLRGAGQEGLGSLRTKRGNIIRPLLFVEKKEILYFLKKSNQPFRIDKSNFDRTITRNKIRLNLIPYLEKNYNPKIKQVIAKTSEILNEQSFVIDKIARKYFEKLSLKKTDRIFFSKKELCQLDDPLLKKIFRQTIMELIGNLKNVEAGHFFEFKKTMLSQKAKKKKLKLGRLTIKFDKEMIIFKKN